MLKYLVTSKTRRSLLKLLWGEGRTGSASDFSRWGGVAFAGAYNELREMEKAGLVHSLWRNGERLYRTIEDHPMKPVLQSLIEHDPPSRTIKENSTLKGELAFIGLPVNVPGQRPAPGKSVEHLLASACKLARTDASVARSLPLLLERHVDELDFDLLKRECRALGEKHTMGFYLELLAELDERPDLRREAEGFRDKRRKKLTPLIRGTSEYSLRLAEMKTPALARKWNLSMNMTMDSFASTFRKHNRARLHAS